MNDYMQNTTEKSYYFNFKIETWNSAYHFGIGIFLLYDIVIYVYGLKNLICI